MEAGKNRATGWRHAKLSGHKNEAIVESLFKNEDFRTHFSKRLGIGKIISASAGGLCEKDVECALGGLTKSKTDLVLNTEDGRRINISIKKSAGGQVYLIGVDRFISGYEKQFSCTIPDDIQDSLKLFFFGHPATTDLLNNPAVTEGQSKKVIAYQKRKRRLVWDSLKQLNSQKAERLLNWFKANSSNLADFCFSRGLAKHKSDWAEFVWYVNYLGEADFDAIYSIEDIKTAVKENIELIVPGKRGGGTTILLPFGFVQWHLEQIQFHHKLSSLTNIVESV